MQALEAFAKGERRRIEPLAGSLEGIPRSPREASGAGSPVPTRMSFVTDGRNVRVAALTGTTMIPEREVGVDPTPVDETIRTTRDAEPARLGGPGGAARPPPRAARRSRADP